MSNVLKESKEKTLPNPVSLTPEEIRQVAAGTAAALAVVLLRPPILAGGFPVGPLWGDYSAT